MLVEIAKPIALLLCMLSLLCVFQAAFLVPASDLEQRSWDSLILLSLAAGTCLTSGMIFRESTNSGDGSLTRTLPIQIFCWAAGLMVAWFLASWYLETHCIFYKDVRRL
jgi:hypothetical protein